MGWNSVQLRGRNSLPRTKVAPRNECVDGAVSSDFLKLESNIEQIWQTMFPEAW